MRLTLSFVFSVFTALSLQDTAQNVDLIIRGGSLIDGSGLSLSGLFVVRSLHTGAERVSEAARDLAISRFRLIQPYLEQKLSLQLVASDVKICFRTAQRWVASIEN